MPVVEVAALLARGGLLGQLDTLGALAAAGQEFNPDRMAANTSQRKAQTIILAAQAVEYQAWWLIADCGTCGPRDITFATLLPEQTISQMLRRLRCQGLKSST